MQLRRAAVDTLFDNTVGPLGTLLGLLGLQGLQGLQWSQAALLRGWATAVRGVVCPA